MSASNTSAATCLHRLSIDGGLTMRCHRGESRRPRLRRICARRLRLARGRLSSAPRCRLFTQHMPASMPTQQVAALQPPAAISPRGRSVARRAKPQRWVSGCCRAKPESIPQLPQFCTPPQLSARKPRRAILSDATSALLASTRRGRTSPKRDFDFVSRCRRSHAIYFGGVSPGVGRLKCSRFFRARAIEHAVAAAILSAFRH